MKNLSPLKFVIILTFTFVSAISAIAQVDIARQTTAMTYPLDELVDVRFRGTTRFPRLSGSAKIKRTAKNGTEIVLSVDKMPRPFELGAGYATYVVWAISPDGQIDNLGEIKRRGLLWFDSKISVTSKLQTFALIVTAEPHFLVRRPSRAIMLENLSASSITGRVIITTKSVQYFGNTSDYFSDPRTPEIAEIAYSKTPSTILQAMQAVALARYAGAERDAREELQISETLLLNAENARAADRADEDVDIFARNAISAAVKAEDTALTRKQARVQRNEKIQQDAEIQKAEDKYQDALQQVENLKFELSRETRNRELAERDALNYSKQIKDLRDENAQIRADLEKARAAENEVKIQLAKLEGEKNVSEKQRLDLEKQRDLDQRRSRLQINAPQLMLSLKPFGAVKQNDRGIVLTLSESYWAGLRVSSFAPALETKIGSLASLLAGNADYKFFLESHTDSGGSPEELQTLTTERAQAIADRLMTVGVDPSRIDVKGFGAALPIAPNTTNSNRAKNRRIDVILVPNVN